MPKLAFLLLAVAAAVAAPPAKVVLVAGKPSHPPGCHEHNAGVLLLEKCLLQNKGVTTAVVKDGWPLDESVLTGARAVVFFMDGGPGNSIYVENRRQTLARLMDQGVGLVLLHYALEPGAGGREDYLEWAGGFWDRGYSANPINDVEVTRATPDHPISRGWKSFAAKDEWYYRLRFRPDDKRLVPILTTMLPKDAPNREVIAWAIERAGGGRGFGFTGGHFHTNWGIEAQRRLVVNAILWTAKVNVPKGGALCRITPEELAANLDPKPAPKK